MASRRAGWLLFRLLNVAALRGHRLRTALSVAGIGIGVMLVCAILIVNASLTGSYATSSSSLLGGADLLVTSPAPAGVDAGLADRLRHVPGVRVAAPLLVEPAVLRGPHGAQVEILLVGADGRLASLDSALARQAAVHAAGGARPGLAMTPSLMARLGTAPGSAVDLLGGDRPVPLPVSATITGDAARSVLGGRTAALPLPLAEQVLGAPGLVTEVAVAAADAREPALRALRARLQDAAGPAVQVVPATQALDELRRSSATLRSSSIFFSLLALLVGGYLVYTTMSIAAVERRREAATLLALGEWRGRLLARFLTEAALLGVAGTAAGLALGTVLGRTLTGTLPRYLQDAYGFQAESVVPATALLLAGVAGVAAAVAAAAIPGIAVLRLPPAESLRPQAPGEAPADPRGRRAAVAAGTLLVVAGLAGVVLVPQKGTAVAAVLLTGAVLAGPAVFTAGVRAAAALLVHWPARAGGALAQLAGANLLQSPRRTVGTVAAAAFSLVLVVAVGASTESLQHSVDHYADAFSNVDLYVSASADDYDRVLLSPGAVDAVAAVPGVRSATPFRATFTSWRGRRVWTAGDDPASFAAIALSYAAGSPRDAARALASGGAVVSTQLERLDGVHVGDVIRLATAAGPRPYRVGAVVDDWSWAEGVVVIGAGRFAADFRQPQVNQVEVRVAPGRSRAAVAAAIRTRLGPRLPLRINDLEQVRANIDNEQSQLFAPFVQMRDVVIAAAVLAVFNTMLIAVLQRRREIGVLRAVGVQGGEVAAALVLEGAAIVAVALAAGALLGSVLHYLGVGYLVATTGLPLHWSFEGRPLLVGAAAAALMAAGGTLWPARQAARMPILEAIAYE